MPGLDYMIGTQTGARSRLAFERYLANMKYEYQIRRVGADPTRDFDFANNRLNVADYNPIATGSTMSAKYCGECGGRLDSQWLESELQFRAVCSNCHSITYENPRVLVWCYLYWQDKLIFCHNPRECRCDETDRPSLSR